MDRPARTYIVRDATQADSKSLLRLVGTSTASRGVRWTIDRQSDFFTPFRAETGGWRVLMAEDRDSGVAVGCVSVTVRNAWLEGQAQRTCYVSNLLVHPDWRGRGIGDDLCWRVVRHCRHVAGERGPVLLAIREGNRHMRGRVSGPRGLPGLHRLGRVDIHSIRTYSLRRGRRDRGVTINSATLDDLEEMAHLSRRVFAERQFAPVFEVTTLGRWIARAPGLEISDYLVARRDGELVGWLGLWDESVVRRVRVAGYSRITSLRYAVRDAFRRVTGSPQAPKVGDVVRCAAVVHACIPEDGAETLRAILEHAADGAQSHGCAWVRMALDRRDPLLRGLSGLRARASSFHAHLATPAGVYDGPALGDRPVHFEAALA